MSKSCLQHFLFAYREPNDLLREGSGVVAQFEELKLPQQRETHFYQWRRQVHFSWGGERGVWKF